MFQQHQAPVQDYTGKSACIRKRAVTLLKKLTHHQNLHCASYASYASGHHRQKSEVLDGNSKSASIHIVLGP